MFIVNAPFLFTGIWAIVKMWIDDKTKEKIKILGGSYKKDILKFVIYILNIGLTRKSSQLLRGWKLQMRGKRWRLSELEHRALEP